MARVELDTFNLRAAEATLVEAALRQAGSIAGAADLLGTTREGVKRRIILHRIEWPRTRPRSFDRPMMPREAWLYAAEWGSFVTNGDPGACMYGFSENAQPQSEEHRARCLRWIDERCMPHASAGERVKLRRLREYLADAPLVADPVGPFSDIRTRMTHASPTHGGIDDG